MQRCNIHTLLMHCAYAYTFTGSRGSGSKTNERQCVNCPNSERSEVTSLHGTIPRWLVYTVTTV